MLDYLKKFFDKEIPILMYHRLVLSSDVDSQNIIHLSKEKFEEQLMYLKKNKFETITFADLKNISLSERKKRKYIILTFDDGYEDNYSILYPLLKKYNMKAVIYLVSNINYNKWDVDELGEKKLNLLSREQILEMNSSGLIEFGGHTANHVKLDILSKDEQLNEIKENKVFLEEMLGKKLISFAYPYGRFNNESKGLVKDLGYEYGIATNKGDFFIETDQYEVRRIGIFSDITLSKFKRRVSGKYNMKYRRKK